MVLTKKEQELLIYMLSEKGFRLNIKKQKIFNSKAIYESLNKLIKLDFIRPFKSENGCSYQLTDKGIFLSAILNRKHGLDIKYVLLLFY